MANPNSEEISRQETRAANDYALYAGQQDPLIQAILQLLQRVFGTGSGNLISELGLIGQQISGLGNSTINGSVAVRGAVQYNGLPASMGGTLGTVGGSDVIATAAAEAFRREMMKTFTNPMTGQLNRAAGSLNAQEVHQAVKYALERGAQYSGTGAVVSGTRSAGGGIDWSAAPGQIKGMESEVKGVAAVISSMKDVLGGQAVADLERSLTALFGGSHRSMSASNMVYRMSNIKAMASAFFGGDTSQAVRYALASQASIATSIGGPGMGMEEANYKFGGISSLLSTHSERMAMAAGQAGAYNSSIRLGKNGETIPVRNPTELTDEVNKRTGKAVQQESMLALAEHAVATRPGVTDAQRKQMENLRNELSNATTVEGVSAARSKMATLFYGITGMSQDQYIEQNGGMHNILNQPTVQENVAGVASNAVSQRANAQLRQNFEKDYAWQRGVGMTSKEAGVFGTGINNLSVDDKVRLEQALSATYASPGEKYIAVAGALSSGARKDLESRGVNYDEFIRLVSDKGSVEKMGYATAAGEGLAGFGVGAGQVRVAGEKMADEKLKALMGGRDSVGSGLGDHVTSFLQAAVGTSKPSDATIIEQELKKKDSKVISFDTADDGNIKAGKDNYEKAKQALSPDVLRKLGVTDAASFGRMLGDGASRGKFYDVLANSGAGVRGSGNKFHFLDAKSSEEMDKVLKNSQLENATKSLLGDAGKGIQERQAGVLGDIGKEGMTAKTQLGLSGLIAGRMREDPGFIGKMLGRAVNVESSSDHDAEALLYMIDNDMLTEGSKTQLRKEVSTRQKALAENLEAAKKGPAEGEDSASFNEKVGRMRKEQEYLDGIEARFDKAQKEAQFGTTTIMGDVIVHGKIENKTK